MCLLCRTCAGHPNDTSNQLLTTPRRVPTRAINQSGICRLPVALRHEYEYLFLLFPPCLYPRSLRGVAQGYPSREPPTPSSPALQAARPPSVGFHVSHFLAVLPHRLCVSFSTMWCALVLKHASGMVRRDGRARDVRPAACGSAYAV